MTKTQESDLKWALCALDLVWNGLKYDGFKETDDPKTCSTALWNLRTAHNCIREALNSSTPQKEQV